VQLTNVTSGREKSLKKARKGVSAKFQGPGLGKHTQKIGKKLNEPKQRLHPQAGLESKDREAMKPPTSFKRYLGEKGRKKNLSK